jgi:hypothetical protein
MTDIYDIANIPEFLPKAIFLSLLSLTVLIFIYFLISKKILRDKELDRDKIIFEKYDFKKLIFNLAKKQDFLDKNDFLKELLHIYIKFLNYKFQVDFSSKTLEEVKKISKINKDQLELFQILYLSQYLKDYNSSSNPKQLFEITKKQILY